MWDEQLINRIDFMPDSSYGRGGFTFEYPKFKFYNDYSVIETLRGHYLNPLGPFKKEVTIYMVVIQKYMRYQLSYKTEFWGSCSISEFIDSHLRPFLWLFRKYINNEIEASKLYGEYRFLSKNEFPNYSAGTSRLIEEKEKQNADELFILANHNRSK